MKHSRRVQAVDLALRMETARVRLALAVVKLSQRLRRIAAAMVSPAFVIVVLLASGFACAVAGVLMLAGTAWALITAAALLFALAFLMLRGASNG